VGLNHQIDREVLDAAQTLKVIVSPTTGLDHIDAYKECWRRGINILSLRDDPEFLKSIHATAEHTVALMLALLRGVVSAANHCAHGGWNRKPYLGQEVYGNTVGIVGFGRVGRQVANLLKPWGCSIITKDKNSGVDLPALLGTADIVINCTADQVWGQHQFSQFRWASYFINTARGYNVHEGHLLEALRRGQLAGAALDVRADESDRRRDPLSFKLDPLCYFADKHPGRLIITPHIAGFTMQSVVRTEIRMRKILKAYLEAQGASES
jgi:D-3-phosphoglycerate dehydrogenase